VRVTVVGAGKMGLPVAVQFASRGATVFACDLRKDLVDAINAGCCPIDEPGVEGLLRPLVERGALTATTTTASAVAESEAIVVLVPALLLDNRDVDPCHLIAVAEVLATSMPHGAMVCFETTLPVGGTRRLLLPVLERHGRRAGRDFDLVFSPERVKSQKVLQHLTINPKVVGGWDERAAERAERFYARYLGAPVINVGTLEAAEMVKLAGMVYRDVNIALANELGRYAESVGVALPALLSAINSDGEAAVLQPGVGVGGHCTPVYPYFYMQEAARRGVSHELAAAARRINDGQVGHLVDRLEQAAGPVRGKDIGILGLGFRPNVKEHIYSPAFPLNEELLRRGANVWLHDPLYDAAEIRAHGFIPRTHLEAAPSADTLILNTAHAFYTTYPFESLAPLGLRVVVDGRNALDARRLQASSILYIGVGRPIDPAVR